jgi:transposase
VVTEQYVALDVSLKLIRAKAPQVARRLETGATSPCLFHALTKAGLPVVCMDSRQARAALSMRPTKSDRNDARGLADMLRMGWYRRCSVENCRDPALHLDRWHGVLVDACGG